MKFTTTTIAAIATALALSTTSSNAFSIGGKARARFDPLAGQVPTLARNRQNIRSSPLVTLAATSTPDVDEEVQRLQAMAAKLRQEAAELEAQQASERAQAIERAFNKFDTDHDGGLSLDELKAALEKTFKLDNLPEERVQRLMNDFDTSGDGKIQKDEFVSIDQFRNRLEALASEERKKALDATKAAQQEEEIAKLIESQLELINDKPPTTSDKIVSTLPYLFPLMDGLLFGSHLLAGNESNPVVAALALLYTVYRSIPLGGFLAFFALSAFSGNLSINRLVRFNMRQAIFLDVALFIPGVLAALTGAITSGLGVSIPPMVGELSSDALFVTLVAILGYSVVSSLAGVTPDKVPFISKAVNNRLPNVDDLQFINPTTGEPILKNKKSESKNDDESDKGSNNQD